MPISFECSCGRQLQVPDEHAGKRVRCPKCEETLLVPSGAAGDAPAGLVRFRCACGKQMQAQAAYAGEVVECPACGGDVVIPGRERDRAGSIRADRPERQPAVLAEADGPGGARGKSKKKKGALLPLLLAAVAGGLLFLCGGTGLGIYWFFFRDSANDLALVPPDAQGFVCVRLADVWKTDLARDTVRKLTEEGEEDPATKMRDEIGLGPEDVERLTVVVMDDKGKQNFVILSTIKPYDRQAVLSKLGFSSASEVTYMGRNYHVAGKDGNKRAVHFAGKRVLVAGPEEGVKRCLLFQDFVKVEVKESLNDSLAAAKGKNHVVVGFRVPEGARQELRDDSKIDVRDLAEMKSGTVIANVTDQLQVEAILRFAESDQAVKGKKAVERLVRAGLVGGGLAGDAETRSLRALLDSLEVKQRGHEVTLTARTNARDQAGLLAKLLANLPRGGNAVGRVQHQNNLKQIVLALHMYHDVHQRFPPAVVYAPDGRPLYSWRVELLPYLEHENLWREFNRGEPWNSPNNSRLLSRMPRVFALPGQEKTGQTPYQFFVGPRTLYPDRFSPPPRMVTITDGTANTILVAEAARPVPWTQPTDIHYFPQQSMKPALGQRYGRFYVGLADGSVRTVKLSISDTTLHAAITPNAGDLLGPDW
jgi:hypothetical protein